MEQKKKKLTLEQIAELEKSKVEQIREITAEYEPRFSELGYYLVTKFFVLASDSKGVEDYNPNTEANYSADYICQGRITVERDKTEEELDEENEIADENRMELGYDQDELAEETDEIEDEADDNSAEEVDVEVEEDVSEDVTEEVVPESDSSKRKTLAFSEVLVLKVYKSFFFETIVTLDDFNQLKSDLDEFLTHFTEEKQKENND